MAHHKPKKKVATCGLEIRMRRDRKRSKSKLTKRGYHFGMLKDPDPTGKKPGAAWKFYYYPLEKKSRKRRAEAKKIERRRHLKRDEREAMKEQLDENA